MLFSSGSVGGNLLLHKMSFLSYSYKLQGLLPKDPWDCHNAWYSLSVCLQICVCVDCALRAVVSHRTLHVTFRTWNHVKSKCLNIFRATIHGGDVMDWTKDSGVIYRLGGLRQGHMSTQRSVGIWSHVTGECHSTERWLTANSAALCFFAHKRYLVLALYSLFEYRRRKSLFCCKSSIQQICTVSALSVHHLQCFLNIVIKHF